MVWVDRVIRSPLVLHQFVLDLNGAIGVLLIEETALALVLALWVAVVLIEELVSTRNSFPLYSLLGCTCLFGLPFGSIPKSFSS